jgi:hypothetical protein
MRQYRTITSASETSLLCTLRIAQQKRTFLVFRRFFYLVCEAFGAAATPGLLCQPRVIVKMIVEKQMECILAGETDVLGENLPKRHFCPSQNPTWSAPGLNPARRGGNVLKVAFTAAEVGWKIKSNLRRNNEKGVGRGLYYIIAPYWCGVGWDKFESKWYFCH